MDGECTGSELAAGYGVHPTMVHQWKEALHEGTPDIFGRGGKRASEINEDTMRSVHAKIAVLAVANDFCCKGSSPGLASEARDDQEEPLELVR